jgi:beta-lactam-binding protein with PASTA domain
VSEDATMPSQTAVMPDLTGKTASEVVSALFEAGLNPTYSGDLLGLASTQGVPPGTTVPRWSRVYVAFTRETAQ